MVYTIISNNINTYYVNKTFICYLKTSYWSTVIYVSPSYITLNNIDAFSSHILIKICMLLYRFYIYKIFWSFIRSISVGSWINGGFYILTGVYQVLNYRFFLLNLNRIIYSSPRSES